MTTHVLVMNPTLSFAVSLKQALERTGAFSVHPFTTPDAAFDYLRSHPQDVALIDFTMPGIRGDVLIQRLREIQPDLALVVSPVPSATIMQRFNLQDAIAAPYTAREIIPLLNRAAASKPRTGASVVFEPPVDDEDTDNPPPAPAPGATRELPPTPATSAETKQLPDTGSLPEPLPPTRKRTGFTDMLNSMRIEESRPPLPQRTRSMIDFSLPENKPRETDSPPRSADTQESALFKRLAAEEPPLPTLEENGTIGDLMTGVTDTSFRSVLSILRGDDTAPGESGTAATVSDEELNTILESFYGGDDEPEPAAPPPARSAAPEPDEDEDDPYRNYNDARAWEFSPAQMILETALDESTPPESFSLEDLIASIEQKLPAHRPNVQPLPSWLGDLERIVAEPDFLPEELPTYSLPSDEYTGAFADQTTRPSSAQRVIEGDYDTDSLDYAMPTQPVTVPVVPDEAVAEAPAEPVMVEPEAVEDVPVSQGEYAVEATQDAPGWDEATQVEFATPEPAWDELDEDVSEPAAVDAGWDQAAEYDEAEPVAAGWDDVEEQDEIALVPADWGDTVEETQDEFAPAASAWDEPDAVPELERMDAGEFESALFDTDFERLAAFDFPDAIMIGDTPSVPMPVSEDPRIAQLALSLTQVSLELTAEATLLTRNGVIVAFAGELTEADVHELRAAIADDWDADTDESRIRFITLPGSGKDYMLYSRRTADDLTLSMIFGGTTPLRDIRRQGKRLVEALHTVPESSADTVMNRAIIDVPTERVPEPEPVAAPVPAPIIPPEPKADPATLTTYTCVWILRDANARLKDATAQAIMSGLRMQLRERGWQVTGIQAQDEYVYLLGDVPGETPTPEIVRDLKRRSAAIAHALEPALDPEFLWAESYLVVTPGRELELDEIQQFISFERM